MTVDLLVLGGSGRVGRLLRGALARSDALRAELAPPGRTPRLMWQCRRGPTGADIMKWQPGAALPEGLRARAILALWGVTEGPATALAQNATLARAALHLAQRIGADRVLHASSGAVHAGLTGAPAQEEAPLAPLGPYGTAKAEMERVVAAWHARRATTGHTPGDTGPRSLILRLGNIAGADSLSRALVRPGPITLDRFGGSGGTAGGPRRAYLGIEDLARALGALLRLPGGAMPTHLNLAGPAPVAMEALARAAGREVLWRPAPAAALPVLALNTTRLSALAGGPLHGSADPGALLAQWHRAEAGA
ncbi:NAD dependent epimerase/dehydratase family protein [Pseudooceanicola marinus]|uniref:NAD dependent epimerase/dehydratase family protein n=1 Tax=Pseudooceanicola marinus TaxID=396013 RepID=A0A1X6ZPV2_9RHOB|nr:NAD-dependent epimerase/dehydratase family protein [Pseudooceanicola marinus]PJE26736.1 NAD-dependent epimerase/dehydratase [Pseudooceanicola marinus]SLN57359.1 NAD dependent epimerase/dehydratase family protein [Pseudooceanicola marinus]